MVIAQAMRLSFAGIGIGIIAALGITRLIASFLFGVRPRDPVVFVFVPLILIGVALIAVWRPARRATLAIRLKHFGMSDGPCRCGWPTFPRLDHVSSNFFFPPQNKAQTARLRALPIRPANSSA